MLMDEPFGALDALTRLSLQDVLRQLIAQERPTVLLVTHDVDEALFLADRIVVFSACPARVLREFNLAHRAKSHDLSDLADEKREILRLLGISVGGRTRMSTWRWPPESRRRAILPIRGPSSGAAPESKSLEHSMKLKQCADGPPRRLSARDG